MKCSGSWLKWKNVARQLNEAPSSAILLTEEDHPVLRPGSATKPRLCHHPGPQNTFQQVLGRGSSPSGQLLELYLQALEKEGSLLSKQEGRTLCRQSYSENSGLMEASLGRTLFVMQPEPLKPQLLGCGKGTFLSCPANYCGELVMWLYGHSTSDLCLVSPLQSPKLPWVRRQMQ